MITLARALPEDQWTIKALADRHRKEIGFLMAPAVRVSIDAEELWVAQDGPALVGFARFHHRRDRLTKLYEICVAEEARGHGVGRRLIEAVREQALRKGQLAIILKAPEDLPANEFYRRLGFTNVGSEPGKRRPLRLWQLDFDGIHEVPA